MKLTATLLFLLTLILSACQAAPVSFIATTYQLESTSWDLKDMNDSCVVVGVENYRAFKAENGIKTFLQLPSEYIYSKALAVGNSGIIVGSAATPTSGYKPCYWDIDGQMHLLPDYYGGGGEATAINNKNEIAGPLYYAGYNGWAAVWTDFTNRRILDYTGYMVTGMNDQGTVIADYNGYRAYCWSETQKRFMLLASPSGLNSSASRINNRGQILGRFTDGSSTYNDLQVVWTDYQNPYILPKPKDAYGNSRPSSAYDISDSGYVVGYASMGNNYYSACMWDDSSVYYLDNLVTQVFDGQTRQYGVKFTEALYINNNNQILCRGKYGYNRSTFYLLTPVPEPSSLLSLLCGLGGVGGMVVRKRSSR